MWHFNYLGGFLGQKEAAAMIMEFCPNYWPSHTATPMSLSPYRVGLLRSRTGVRPDLSCWDRDSIAVTLLWNDRTKIWVIPQKRDSCSFQLLLSALRGPFSSSRLSQCFSGFILSRRGISPSCSVNILPADGVHAASSRFPKGQNKAFIVK